MKIAGFPTFAPKSLGRRTRGRTRTGRAPATLARRTRGRTRGRTRTGR